MSGALDGAIGGTATAPLPSGMLSRRDIAQIFAVDRTTVRTWERSLYLPEPIRIGNRPYWSREAISSFLAGREKAADGGGEVR